MFQSVFAASTVDCFSVFLLVKHKKSELLLQLAVIADF